MTRLEIRQPSADECNANARIDVGGERLAFAAWYPQMGGYGALCVVVSGNNANPGDDPSEACFDVHIWHDGDFPYSAETDIERLGYARAPAVLHHCRAKQFINFGQVVVEQLRKGKQ